MKLMFVDNLLGASSHSEHPHDLIVSGSEDRTVCVWDMDTGICKRKLRHDHIVSVAIQGSIVVAGSGNSSAAVWDISQVQVEKHLDHHFFPSKSIYIIDMIKGLLFHKNIVNELALFLYLTL